MYVGGRETWKSNGRSSRCTEYVVGVCVLQAVTSSSLECFTLKVKAVLSETSGNSAASEPNSVDV